MIQEVNSREVRGRAEYQLASSLRALIRVQQKREDLVRATIMLRKHLRKPLMLMHRNLQAGMVKTQMELIRLNRRMAILNLLVEVIPRALQVRLRVNHSQLTVMGPRSNGSRAVQGINGWGTEDRANRMGLNRQ